MGRASRKVGGPGGGPAGGRGPFNGSRDEPSDGSRDGSRDESNPRPEQDSILLGIDDDCLVYYSPRVDKVLSTPVDLEIIIDSERDVGPEYFEDNISNMRYDLLEQARKNLREKGEIDVVSISIKEEAEFYEGPSHDRLEQRWSSSSVEIEGILSLDDQDTEVWEEDSIERERALTNWFGNIPEVQEVLAALDAKEQRLEEEAARHEAAIMKEELRRAQAEIGEGKIADEPDSSSQPESREEEARREKFEEERYAEEMRPIFEERAEEIAEDRDGKDWKSLSPEEQERRIREAEMIIVDEEVARREG